MAYPIRKIRTCRADALADPKEELPEYYKVVEVKWYGSGLIRISTAWLSAGDAGGYLWTIEGTSRLISVKNILGWREIHE